MEPLQMNGKMVPELPENWVWTTLGGCVDILDRKRVPINAKERDERKGNIPYYGATGQVGWIDDYLFDEELVLLGEDGAPFFDSTKNTAYIIRGKSWVNNHAHVLRAIFGVTLNQFLCNYLNNFNYQGHVTGTTRHKLNQSQMRIIPLPLPPLPEQHRIVTKVEELFTRLDAGVVVLTKAKAQLKRYRQSVLKSACEGRLVPTEAELARAEGHDYEPADVLLARIGKERREMWGAEKKRNGKKSAKYKEPAAPDVSGLPELPEGWCYTLLDPLLSTNRAGMKTGPFGSLLKKHEHMADGVPVVGIENIAAMKFITGSKIHITKEKSNQLSGYDALPGDVLISRSGTVGEVCVVPESIGEARISTNVMRVTVTPHGMLPHFFCFLSNGAPFILGQVSELCKGSTRDFLNQKILSSIIFPLPPLLEQHRIVAEIERRLSVADETEKTIDQCLKQAERLRQSILKRAFEGKLVPQDPNDEPASVLLEQIILQKEINEKNNKSKRRKTRGQKTR